MYPRLIKAPKTHLNHLGVKRLVHTLKNAHSEEQKEFNALRTRLPFFFKLMLLVL